MSSQSAAAIFGLEFFLASFGAFHVLFCLIRQSADGWPWLGKLVQGMTEMFSFCKQSFTHKFNTCKVSLKMRFQ